MKTWHYVLLGIFIGLIASGLILLIAGPPRGEPVSLAPLPTTSLLVVHVSGSVVHPGVYPLDPGSRVEDAIEAAGGLSPEADPDLINLAAPLYDGMKLVVYAKGVSLAETDLPVDLAVSNETTTSENNEIININTASQSDLETLPGIGEVRATDIIAYREEHGAFTSIEEIQEVKGIGPEIFAKIKDRITVGTLP